MRDPILNRTQRAFVDAARRAVLATIARDGRPRTVPICFVLDRSRPVLYTPIDEKPKVAGDAHALARVRDIERDPRVSVLVDRWDEDWSRLGWVRMRGSATLLEPGGADADEHGLVVAMLRERYAPYRDHDLERRPIIRVSIEQAIEWGAIRG